MIYPLNRYAFAIDEQILTAAREGAIFALNLSGGKDSTMTAHAASRILDQLGHPRERRLLLHADLGRAEWRSTAATVKRQADSLGLPLHIVSREAGDMVDRWESRYRLGIEQYSDLKLARMRSPWSSASMRFCTAELKRDVLHKFLRKHCPGETIVSVLGIRHAESVGRSRTPVSKPDVKLRRADGTRGLLWHPSISISTDDVYKYHRDHGLELHEAYTRHGASRVSCAFCVIASRPDLTIAASVATNDELFHHLVDMEITTGFSFQQNRWLADIDPTKLSPKQRESLLLSKDYAADRRRLEADIPKSLIKGPAGTKWPWRLPTPDEATAIARARTRSAEWTGIDFPYTTAISVREKINDFLKNN